jgi:hypothetical protein
MADGVRGTFSGTATDLWQLENWIRQFPRRTSLDTELTLLERLFPLEWRIGALREPTSKHQLRGDLRTIGGQSRVLGLANELLQMMALSGGDNIPVQGRLRCWNLYQPTKSELLVGPILRPVGDLSWQPEGAGHGADYQVRHPHYGLVAEVKRVCTSVYQERVAIGRAFDSGDGRPIFTPDESEQNMREDARRLYPRVRHGARQLARSAVKAAKRLGRPLKSLSGVLFLDLDGHPYLGNITGSIRGWMELPWAKSIELVLFFDYACREDVWGTVSEPIYARDARALDMLASALPICDRGHFHVGNLPVGPCRFPLPL